MFIRYGNSLVNIDKSFHIRIDLYEKVNGLGSYTGKKCSITFYSGFDYPEGYERFYFDDEETTQKVFDEINTRIICKEYYLNVDYFIWKMKEFE